MQTHIGMRAWSWAALSCFVVGSAQAQSTGWTVKVNIGSTQSAVRDLLGVNKPPSFSSRTPGVTYDAGLLYRTFGVSQARLHDSGVDLCTVYTAATRTNAGVSPPTSVSGCTLTATGSAPRYVWTPSSSADADLNNPDNYDFSAADDAIRATLAAGGKIYLGLAQGYNGPNDTTDPVAWAKVATNIYRHVIGVFKPTSGIAVDPAFVEIHNEPDGGFWRGDAATFYTLYRENTQRVRDAATAAGKTLRVGGAGFTRSILTTSNQAGNPANGFINAVGASSLDFYSAHLYDKCASASLSASGSFLRSLRARVDSTGGAGKPLHISEWNIGLGNECGESFFANQRNQSFASGILTLMQDPSLGVEAAHYYAGVTVMSLFDFTSVANAVRVNPAAWAFWAHAKLAGGNLVDTQVCSGASCVAGYAADTLSLQALGGQRNGNTAIVVTNDTGTALDYTLQLSGLASSTANVTVSTPPSGTRDIALAGSPAAANTAALNLLSVSSSVSVREGLAVAGAALSQTISIPAYTVQLIEVRTSGGASAAQSECLFNWAERNYSQYFSPGAASSAAFAPYTFRYYTKSQNYLATSSANNRVWVLGPDTGNVMTDVGSAATLLSSAGCTQ